MFLSLRYLVSSPFIGTGIPVNSFYSVFIFNYSKCFVLLKKWTPKFEKESHRGSVWVCWSLLKRLRKALKYLLGKNRENSKLGSVGSLLVPVQRNRFVKVRRAASTMIRRF